MKDIFQTIESFADRVLARMTPMRVLLSCNALLVSLLIILSDLRVIPLWLWDFVFFAFFFFLLALYRSGWAFALLVGMLPLETVNLAPIELGINLRPYQFLAGVIAFSLCVRLATRRIRWPLFVWQWQDVAVFLFLLLGFLLIPFLPFPELSMTALKQSIILLSFGLLYVLGRIFLKQFRDIRIAGVFFASSVCVILLYALWQSLRFKFHVSSFEVMPGRPNGTLPEADFLGGLVAAVLAWMVPVGFQFFFTNRRSVWKRVTFGIFLFLLFLVLILTVARSGWLAAGVGMIAGAVLFFWRSGGLLAMRTGDVPFLKRIVFGKLFFGLPLVLAMAVIIMFHLTAFDVFDRGESFTSGLQKITVSCESVDAVLPERISSMEILEQNGCRHILLEEIEEEKIAGKSVREVYRDDPNINVRKNIYRESWALIRSYPVVGIGWGSVSHFFGMDGRGAGLNASNVFLEIWLGTGIGGLIVFVILWISLPVILMRRLMVSAFDDQGVWALGLIAAWVAFTVFNVFNSGLLLGSMWIYFALLVWFATSPSSDFSSDI